ncbi:hypothetical protein [Rhodothermus profundi]|uniref:Uncharacterized protein n=1 Tax=Rhodothermus profundi TaxID=633813 RepID=A0A1M6PY58_9BACT|nr:hypothetical protein [Rhodothermus profundi]SHK12842.1 hypothetical protein SAMN04488087_0381 [Rhodothermus profundi]
MPVEFRKRSVVLRDHVTVEEAEPLLSWLQEHPRGQVNLKSCRHLHTACLQVLLAAQPRVRAVPSDPDLRRWLGMLWIP